jgi:DNA-binding NarL/FixJ family response regulator
MNNPTPSPVTKIWILEDHQVFATQIRRLISGETDMVCDHHFTNADDLYEKLRFTQEKPDVLLLDVGLPRKDGIQVLTELHKVLPDLKVIILTAFDDKEKVYRAICNGASGYLLKTADPDEILTGIRDVIHGASALSSPIAKMILEGFSRYGPVDEVEQLTSREEDVLRLLVQGLIKKEIADKLVISQHTVDMHLRSVYRKLHVRTQTEAVSKAIRQGLV